MAHSQVQLSEYTASSMAVMTYDEIESVGGGHNSRTQCPAPGHEHSTWDDLKETAAEVWGWFS